MKNYDPRDGFQHSIWFQKEGETVPKNSYEDFRLFPKNRNKIIVATPNPIYEDITIMDGSYDWYDIVGVNAPFSKATDTYEFYVLSDLLDDYGEYNWVDEYDKLAQFFDGSIFKVWLNDWPDETKVATGRVYLSDWDSPSSGLSECKLTYTLTEEISYD